MQSLKENGLLEKFSIRKRPGTVGICSAIMNKYKVDTVPHIICGGFSKEETENFKQMFYKIQRLYNILNRFVYNYKFKRAKIVVNSDMCLNELKEGDKNVISIIQNNSKYLCYYFI